MIGEKSNDVMHLDYTPPPPRSIFSFSSGSKGSKEYDRYARSASRRNKRFKPNIERSVPSSSADDDMTLTTDMQQSGMSHPRLCTVLPSPLCLICQLHAQVASV